MKLSMILATDKNGAIGYKNNILIKCKEDMQFFKQKTIGKILIMGRKTHESFGGKTLPNRFHIVLTSDKTLLDSDDQENVIYVSCIEDAMIYAQFLVDNRKYKDEIMVIGGAQIYDYVVENHLVDKIYLTVFNCSVVDFDTKINCLEIPKVENGRLFDCEVVSNGSNEKISTQFFELESVKKYEIV